MPITSPRHQSGSPRDVSREDIFVTVPYALATKLNRTESMKIRNFLSALVVGTALAFAACTDNSPSAPAPQAQVNADLLGSVTTTLSSTLNSLLVSCSNSSTISVSHTFDKSGGTMRIGAHTFTVPAGALSTPTTITATALKGSTNHIDFQPEGLRFAKSTSLSISYANCSLTSGLLPKHIAYTSDDLKQIFEMLDGVVNTSNRTVTSKVDHFSDYVLAW